jgi:hypothetical protein
MRWRASHSSGAITLCLVMSFRDRMLARQFAGGARDFFVECLKKACFAIAVPGPVLRDRDRGQTRPGSPQGHQEGGPGGRVRPFHPLPARGRYDAGAVRLSVGGKVAVSTNSAEVLQTGHDSEGTVPHKYLHYHDFARLLAGALSSPFMHRRWCFGWVPRAEAAAVSAMASGSQHRTSRCDCNDPSPMPVLRPPLSAQPATEFMMQ